MVALRKPNLSFMATGQEWRTPRIGLAQKVEPRAGFLHDGRAKTLRNRPVQPGKRSLLIGAHY